MNKEQQLHDLLARVEKLENLKKYYGRLKVKRNNLEEALRKMKSITEEKSDSFEESEAQEFPFQIVLLQNDEYNRKNDVFKISKRDTVTNFTEFLLQQISELLEAFESDLIDEASKGNL